MYCRWVLRFDDIAGLMIAADIARKEDLRLLALLNAASMPSPPSSPTHRNHHRISRHKFSSLLRIFRRNEETQALDEEAKQRLAESKKSLLLLYVLLQIVKQKAELYARLLSSTDASSLLLSEAGCRHCCRACRCSMRRRTRWKKRR